MSSIQIFHTSSPAIHQVSTAQPHLRPGIAAPLQKQLRHFLKNQRKTYRPNLKTSKRWDDNQTCKSPFTLSFHNFESQPLAVTMGYHSEMCSNQLSTKHDALESMPGEVLCARRCLQNLDRFQWEPGACTVHWSLQGWASGDEYEDQNTSKHRSRDYAFQSSESTR